ncbi:response regulator transcription factor [Cohnella herbarum]|uniref:Response regulator n=1 Tax=Cohnella herbarum TaxID=2728023 RepID=A0A7Z2VJW5_9BACL|nr:response regulator [Cohnella herbarum]QJD84224.1 response regulator [Cohnella herbarum]
MKVLLVDDEPLTTESLERYIDWRQLGIFEVKTASNGLEALELLPRFNPDIIVSDVRMPRMNGIEFATEARERYPTIKIIFLSGYSDKEYLKSAIHLKALSYVEKPVKLEELTAAIRESVYQCQSESANRTLTRSVIRHRILAKLMEETVSYAELRQEFGEHVPAFFNKPVRSMAIHMSVIPESDAKLKESWHTEIADRLTDLVGGTNGSECFSGYADNDLLFVLMEADIVSSADFKETARNSLFSLNALYGDKIAFSIGIGNPSVMHEPLRNCCLSSIAAVRSQFYFGTGIVFSEPPAESRRDPSAIAAKLYPDFRHALRSDSALEAGSLVEQLTQEMRRERDPEIGRVKNAFFKLLMILHEFAVEKGLTGTDSLQEEKFIWQEVGEISTLDSLSDYVTANVQAVFSQFKEHIAVNARVSTVMQYIKEHYSDKDLTTRSIADNTYLSQNYMCALFKKKTGKTINEYITEVRLEKAKELLRDRHAKLYEIALAIGITDPNYFSSMFKKSTGFTPSQYRERM